MERCPTPPAAVALPPTERSPVMVQVEPPPVTVAVPIEPVLEARKLSSFVTAPPASTLRDPLPEDPGKK